jgi:hypothetical protein
VVGRNPIAILESFLIILVEEIERTKRAVQLLSWKGVSRSVTIITLRKGASISTLATSHMYVPNVKRRTLKPNVTCPTLSLNLGTSSLGVGIDSGLQIREAQ